MILLSITALLVGIIIGLLEEVFKIKIMIYVLIFGIGAITGFILCMCV